MKKNLIACTWLLFLFFLIGTVISGAPPVYAANNSTFNDLPSQHTAYPYVSFLARQGIVSGFEDGSFRPDKNISRAEMVSLLVRAADLANESKLQNQSYKDVNSKHWAYKNVEIANTANLVKGYNDGSFRPEALVTRAEACAFILRLTSESLPVVSVPAAVTDLPSGYWAEKQVAVAIDSGIMSPVDETKFNPDTPASRSEVCRGLAILLNISPEKSKTLLTGTLVPVKGEVLLNDNQGNMVRITAETVCKVGSKIKTSSDSGAEIRFPDGSGLKLDANTEIEIVASNGRANISRDGSAESIVDYLEIKMIKGRIFGALAATCLEQKTKPETVTADNNNRLQNKYLIASAGSTPGLLLSAQDQQSDKQAAPWYKEQYAKKVRVKVDMPWGVASIRGTIWMNEVGADKQITSVANGEVEISSAGKAESVKAGLSVVQISSQAPPPAPVPMSEEQKQVWSGIHSWVEERAQAIEQAAPVIKATSLLEENINSNTANNIINSVDQSIGGNANITPANQSTSGGAGSETSSSSSLNYNTQGSTYGPATGVQTVYKNVNISAPSITLRNMDIHGDLLLAEGIGEGEVTLNNVTVSGNTVIQGGGGNSVNLVNCTLGTVTIDKENNLLRLVASGSTSVTTVNLNSGAKLEETGLSGPGFSQVTATNLIPENVSVVLSGVFNTLSIKARDINVNVITGSIATISVEQQAQGIINIDLDSGVVVENVDLNWATVITGLGEIKTANLRANNISIEQIPTSMTTIAAGFQAVVGGVEFQAGSYTRLQILEALQALQALISAGLDTQSEIDAAQQAYQNASSLVSTLPAGDELNSLLAALAAYQAAIDAAQASLESTWSLVKSYDQALTSDFGITLNQVYNYTHFALFTTDEIQIGTRKPVSEKIRGLSIVFSQLGNLQIRFYNSADSADAVATATLTGSYINGEGLGTLDF